MTRSGTAGGERVAPTANDPGPRRGLAARIWYGYARAVVALRWLIVVGWATAAAAALILLPPMQQTGGDLE
ncbi:MAG: hypothetical protein GX344_11185, partial [Intrasporangiaceae bacterium]|nr:hypothetical protein [Intrasporangiaceae bacterium]